MMLYGSGVRRGGQVAASTNIDIAPTLLSLLEVPIPSEMKGRVLSEALA